MRGRVLNIGAIGRAIGFVLVAAAIVATAVHIGQDDARPPTIPNTSPIQRDPLARELVHCQAIGMAAQGDADCEAAWAENRRRFFTYRPTDSTEGAQSTERKPVAKPEGQ